MKYVGRICYTAVASRSQVIPQGTSPENVEIRTSYKAIALYSSSKQRIKTKGLPSLGRNTRNNIEIWLHRIKTKDIKKLEMDWLLKYSK